MINIWKKAKEIDQRIKDLKIAKMVFLKNYFIGFIISLLIMIVPIMILVNLLILWFYLLWIQIGFFVCFLLVIYLTLFFGDQAMLKSDDRLNRQDLRYIRNFSFIEYAIIMLVVFIVYIILFKWW